MTDLTKPVQTEWLRKLVAYHESGGHKGDGSDHALKMAKAELANLPEPEPLMVTIRMTPEDAVLIAHASDTFCDVVGCWEINLAHFTALAEQQRGKRDG